MKKTICIFMSFLLVLCISISAFAQTDYSKLYEDAIDLKPVENEILEDLSNSIFYEENKHLTFDNLDNDGILKIYDGSEWLKRNSLNLEELNHLMQNSDWFYRLYFYFENLFIESTVTKGREITDEVRKKMAKEDLEVLESLVGKWHVQSYGYDAPKNENYKQNLENILKNSNNNYSKVYFTAYLSGNIHFAAILVDENSEIKFKIFEGVVNGEMITCDNSDDTLYTFEEIKEIAAQFVPSEPGYYSGADVSINHPSNNTIIIGCASAGAVIILAAAVFVLIYKKKHKKAANNQQNA